MSSDGATVRRPAAPTQSSSSYLQDTPPPPPSPPVASTSTASYSLHTGPPEDASTSDALPVDPATLLRPASRGVEDLANKSCWICYSEEPAGEWVHACRCTLVAHCDCLLEWVTTFQQTHRAAPHCPVCSSTYIIRETQSPFLQYYVSLSRKWHSLSLILAAGALGGSGLTAMTAYGCYAVTTFAGRDVANLILFGRQKWPLSYYLNLPLVPIVLILSRTTLIDSLLPFLPLTLVLSTSTSHPALSGFSDLNFAWPPSPTLTLCLLPWGRLLYLRMRKSVFKYVLGRTPVTLGGLAGLMAEMEGEGQGDREGFVVAAEFDIDVGIVGDNEEDVGQAAGVLPHDAPAEVPANAPPRGDNRLRVGLSRFTSLIVGALLLPSLSATAGALLLYLASRSTSPSTTLLRKILGISSILSASKSPFARRGSWFIPVASTVGLVDPVWIRNSMGGALVLLLRDVGELSAGVLEGRRKRSRKVVGRGFEEGLELDWKDAQSRGVGVSAGVDSNGREARVFEVL